MSTPSDPSPFPTIRPLALTDHTKGFLPLLSQLAPTPPLSPTSFHRQFTLISSNPSHLVVVAEDPDTARIVATGTVFLEPKFIRGAGKVAHIEDVVVDSAFRGGGLGQRVVQYLVDHAKREGCYKVILDCEKDRRGFYEKCGFVEKNVQMAIYF